MKKLFENWRRQLEEAKEQPLETYPVKPARVPPSYKGPSAPPKPDGKATPSHKMRDRMRQKSGKHPLKLKEEGEGVPEGYDEWLADRGISPAQYVELEAERPPNREPADLEAVRIHREGIDAEWSDGVTTSIYFSRRQVDYERD
jgi:hypothetical protein